FAISASISLLKPATPTAPTTAPLTWIGTPPRSTKIPAVTKAVRAWFMLSSISAVAAPPFVPSRWRGSIDLPASSYAIMRRATGAEGDDGDYDADRHAQGGPRQPALRRDLPATQRQRQYRQG